MAYFNHAFKKAFYGATLLTTGASQTANTSAKYGFIGEDYVFVDGTTAFAAAGAANKGFYVCQGSWYTNDKLGGGTSPHGGYLETSKSKMFKPKYITDMWVTECNDEVNSVYTVHIKPTGTGTSCFPCGTDPMLRVDVKGAAALRLLNHNAYHNASGSLPMMASVSQEDGTALTALANGVDMCCVTQGASNIGIAPSIVAINWRDQINNDPILSKLCTATLQINQVASVGSFAGITTAQENAIYAAGAAGVSNDAAGTAAAGAWSALNEYKLIITMKTSCDLQTIFGCSFDTRDNYLLGDLKAIAQMVDEAGNPCVACQGYVISAETTAFKQRSISTETVKRDLILSEGYRQNPFHQGAKDSIRLREIEGTDAIPTTVGNDAASGTCAGKYKAYHILHNVPRFNNPSGVFDNDQYHYVVYIACGTTTAWDADFVALANASSAFGATQTIDTLIDRGGDY